jgi:AGZA family xanthine/uracil permease-like MFS transporter
MARRLARREGRDDVTAMPLGLDAPTTIGLALLVLGPHFASLRQQGIDADAAALATWHLGMAAMIAMGVLKLALSFAGAFVTRVLPRAALLGSIAGIALMLMGFLPLAEAMRVPLVGFVVLGLLLYALVAKGALPGRVPGVLFAFVVGLALYYGFGLAGWLGTGFAPPHAPAVRLALPWPTLGFVQGLPDLVPFLPLVLPFGLLMVAGGINVAESARAAGDDFRTRDILLVEAVSTLVAGVCGGVAQTTPYIGQPAYKHMGARTGYTLLAGVFIGLGGMLGVVAGLVELLPLAVLAPIIVFVALDIAVQAFDATPRPHWPAVALAFLPAIAYLLAIKLGNPTVVPPERFAGLYADTAH